MFKIMKDSRNAQIIEILLQCKVDLQKNFYPPKNGNKILYMNGVDCHYTEKTSNVQRKRNKLQKIRRKK